jgi:hypothetical protein
LLIGPDFPQDTAAEAELLAGLPFINMDLVDPRALQQFTEPTLCHRPKPGTQRNGGRRPMTIANQHQLENTRLKLQELEQLYHETKQDPATSEHVRELTLRSLKKRINQFKDQITRWRRQATSRSASKIPRRVRLI